MTFSLNRVSGAAGRNAATTLSRRDPKQSTPQTHVFDKDVARSSLVKERSNGPL
ncbi:MAG: hypothetical protein AAFM91_09350 [Pseudomonadota bacterium]